jgi:hypothetical protein
VNVPVSVPPKFIIRELLLLIPALGSAIVLAHLLSAPASWSNLSSLCSIGQLLKLATSCLTLFTENSHCRG